MIDTNDLVEDSENAGEEVNVDDAGDENPPYNDQFEDSDDISEGGRGSVMVLKQTSRAYMVEAWLVACRLIFECINIFYFRGNI